MLHLAKALTDVERAFQSIEEGLAQLAPELGLTVAELLAQHRRLHVRDDAGHERDRRGANRAHGLLHHGGFPGHPAPARGRQAGAVPPAPVPAAVRPALPDLRDPRADRRRGRRLRRARRDERAGARSRSRERLARGGGRRLPALVDRQPGARAARRRAARGGAGRASRTRSRIGSTRSSASTGALLDRDRRLAEAADAGAPARAGARPAATRASPGTSSSRPRSAAPGGRRRSIERPIYSVGSGPSMAPVAALTYAAAEHADEGQRSDRLRHGRHDLRRQPGLAAARSSSRRDLARRDAGSATSPGSARST